eukprot:13998586-Ditylum_brightwellii.AAC.1
MALISYQWKTKEETSSIAMAAIGVTTQWCQSQTKAQKGKTTPKERKQSKSTMIWEAQRMKHS